MSDPTEPTPRTRMALALLSGNRCAYPNCPEKLHDRETIFGRIAHIHGQRKGSARWVEGMPAAEVRAISNLIYLCSKHHIEVDERKDAAEKYPPDVLREWKANHEAGADSNPMDEIVELLRKLVPAVPVEWRHRPGAPWFQLSLSGGQPNPNSPEKEFTPNILQMGGGDIGTVTWALQHGEAEPVFKEARQRRNRKWETAKILLTPEGKPLRFIFKFWWDGAERTVTYLWSSEDEYGSSDVTVTYT